MRSVFLLLLVIAVRFAAASDSMSATPQQEIDGLFASYERSRAPGCSVGVIRGGAFIFRHSYGEGSVELGTPLGPDSIFYMASVSKQFTAASVVLAAEQGFLSLDDDIRKYLPELPNYGHIITLRQMLHQTSGLRDLLTLTDLAGKDTSALSSADEVLKLIVRQKGLNNPPGEEFVYSNTNYFLLGIVLKRATGKSLAEFAKENIFKPLGMANTLFYDDNRVVVPKRVAAYEPGSDGSFSVDWSNLYDVVGGGGLMSSVNDLLLWDQNFYSNKLGNGSLATELQVHGVLNDNHPINYALGLWLATYRGLPTVEHSGGTFGYRTELLRFPEQHFSVVLLCNRGDADVESLAKKIADLYLKNSLKPKTESITSSATSADSAEVAGTYLDPRKHMIYRFTAMNGDLMAWGAKLERLGVNEYSDLSGNPITFRRMNGVLTCTLTLEGHLFFSGSIVPPIQLTSSALRRFVGEYHSDELETTYTLSIANSNLYLQNGTQPPITLEPVGPSTFDAGHIGTIVFPNGLGAHIQEFTVFSQRAGGLRFTRLSRKILRPSS